MKYYIFSLIISADVLLVCTAIKLLSTIKFQFPSLDLFKASVDADVEISADDDVVTPRYDVEGFRKRMQALKKDEDGLFDIPPEPVRNDFTGAEILTENYELEIDRRTI